MRASQAKLDAVRYGRAPARSDSFEVDNDGAGPSPAMTPYANYGYDSSDDYESGDEGENLGSPEANVIEADTLDGVRRGRTGPPSFRNSTHNIEP